ncbi:MAG: P-II family nitrogen regulator [Eubacterium sp.]|nr:P-II family nitrogen regulator [Eubacterium sp.]
MNYVISICSPKCIKTLNHICSDLRLPFSVVLLGEGTASRSMLDILGIESKEKRVLLTVASEDQTKKLIQKQKKQMFIDVPGHGIVIAVPIKSIGGGKTVNYLNGENEPQKAKYTPKLSYKYELIVAIANEGQTDTVMNAASAAGAQGGTVLHGKHLHGGSDEKFFNVSIAAEKEVILIVAKAEEKAAIMRSILEKAGPNTAAGTIVFSLPASEVAGIGAFEDNDDNDE